MTLHNISRPVSRPVPGSARRYPQPGVGGTPSYDQWRREARATSSKNSTWRLMSHAPPPSVVPPNHSPKDRTTPSPRGFYCSRIRAPMLGRLKLQAIMLIRLCTHRTPYFEGVPTRPVRRSVHIIRGSRSHGSTERIHIIQSATYLMTWSCMP